MSDMRQQNAELVRHLRREGELEATIARLEQKFANMEDDR